jgi:integrase
VPSNLRAYQKEEIRKLLSVADLRDRCIILMMASGGLRVGGLSDLQVKHQGVLDKDSGIGLLKVYPNSKHDSYTALLTPEAMDAIHSYMEWRKDHGELISDESPLIRDKFDVFMARKNKPKFLKVNTIYCTMARLLDRAGINSAASARP